MAEHDAEIRITDPSQTYRYTVDTQDAYQVWREHIKRCGKTAVLTIRGQRAECWIGGLYVGREPINPPPALPLLGRLTLPLLRWGLRHGLFGRAASAALARMLVGQ